MLSFITGSDQVHQDIEGGGCHPCVPTWLESYLRPTQTPRDAPRVWLDSCYLL